MKPFTQITSLTIPLWLSDVDTDMIIPAQYLTQTTQSGYGQYLFSRLKEGDEHFVFNQDKYKGANILLAGSNFGCGSSREHAVWALQQAGIQVVIAPSFSDIFFNNAAKNGLLLITLDSEVINSMCQENQLTLSVDLEACEVRANEQCYEFNYDPFRRECLLNGQDDFTYLVDQSNKIEQFENQRKGLL